MLPCHAALSQRLAVHSPAQAAAGSPAAASTNNASLVAAMASENTAVGAVHAAAHTGDTKAVHGRYKGRTEGRTRAVQGRAVLWSPTRDPSSCGLQAPYGDAAPHSHMFFSLGMADETSTGEPKG